MRQDKQFHPGEGITSKYFANLLSQYVDSLITVDPHLHRWHSLQDIFTIQTTVLHATTKIAEWIKTNIRQPVLIGPDSESLQWVGEIAALINAPVTVVEKTRLGDQTVKATIPQIEQYHQHTPVIVDDIISTAMTMIATVDHLKQMDFKHIHCLGVHAVFAGDAYHKLQQTKANIVTCNTIPHVSNQIDLSDTIAIPLAEMINHT
jgi:ribose-phosphate pyrophosphokinase